ncbi:TolC family protein [Sansalvadorimonas verongulae]|uniref:TolC family protein n=1 Tax=Sansalvadorimonas verongulae TaxID=2172824 RepID=UPI0018AD1C5B|nr:TolC family protein [Sansalvadorimonas verongulae]
MFSRKFQILSIAISATLLTACSSSAIKNFDPQVATPVSWQEPAGNTVNQNSITTSLLDEINDPQLRQLVEETLTANSNLQKTAINLQIQRLQQRQTDAGRLPTADIELGKSRMTQGGSAPINNEYKLGVNLSWEADVWGRLANASFAANAQTRAMELDYQAARDSLAAQVIKAWIDITLRQQMIETEQSRIHSLLATEEIIKNRYLTGNGKLNDMEAARASSAQASAKLSAMQQEQRDAYRNLAVLRGNLKTDTLPKPAVKLDIPAPPVWIPADVIANRPDLKSAYEKVRAANAEHAVAEKNLLPAFKLSSTISQSRPHLDDLLSGAVVWNLLGNLTAPLFDGGHLKAAERLQTCRPSKATLPTRMLFSQP